MPEILRHFLLELYEIIIQNVLKVKKKLDSTIIVDFILFSEYNDIWKNFSSSVFHLKSAKECFYAAKSDNGKRF